MAQWIPVQTALHSDKFWQPATNYLFAQYDTTVPVLLAEAAHLIAHYPLAFIKMGTQFQWICLQSLEAKLNLFVNTEGQWKTPYIPSFYRGYPFQLIPNSADSQDRLLCFDQASGLIYSDKDSQRDSGSDQPPGVEAQPLIANGQLTDKAAEVFHFLKQCETNRKLTQKAVDALAEQHLIIPWELPAEAGQDRPGIRGLYRIDDGRLNTLTAETIHHLQQQQAIAVAYAQLYSIPQLASLRQRQKAHHAASQQSPSVDLDQLFGSAEDDIFKF